MSNSADVVSMTIKEIMTLIIKEKGITDGIYIPVMELIFGAGADKFPTGDVMPTVKIGIKSIGIQKSDNSELSNDMAVDASVVNPKKKTRKKTVQDD